MIYSYIVKNEIRKTISNFNDRRWDAVVKGAVPNVYHRVSGKNALGGERHEVQGLRQWFERVARIFPDIQLKINNIWVEGWPWNTTAFAQWDATATLVNGDQSYSNRGLLVFSLRWGKLYAIEEFQDTQEVVRGLAIQAKGGNQEAAAAPILS